MYVYMWLHYSSVFHNFKEIVLNQFIGDKEKKRREERETDRKRDLVHRDHELFLIISNSSANQALVSSQMRGSIDGRLVVARSTWY